METAPQRRWHVVTTALVAATVAAHVVQRVLPLGDLEALARMGSLLPARVAEHGEYYRLVMPLFLHHGALHLGLNLLALVQLGVLVEEFFGSRRALVAYVTTGVAGLLASALLTAVPYPTSVGASGAVLGLAGVLSGTMWFGTDPVRSELVDLLGRRLTLSVALTFVFGLGLWFVSDVIDNWAHAGGFLCGVCLSFVWADPAPEVDGDDDDEGQDSGEVRVRSAEPAPDEPVYRTVAAGAAALVLLGSAGWAARDGSHSLDTLQVDTARTFATRVSLQPGAWENAALLDEMLDRFERGDAAAEGLDTFTRAVDAFEDPWPLDTLIGLLDLRARGGTDRDRALQLVAQRYLEVAPTDPTAMNAVAWYLVTPRDEALRDAARAEALATRALATPAPPMPMGCSFLASDPRAMEAQVLDTRAEARFQLGRFDEALADQERAVELARELELSDAPELEARLSKIRRSARGG